MQWATDASGDPTRLPPLGPPTPVSVSTLLLVTENMQTAVHSIRQGDSPRGILTCSLSFPDEAKEKAEQHSSSLVEDEYGIKTCSRAVIGLGYNGQNKSHREVSRMLITVYAL